RHVMRARAEQALVVVVGVLVVDHVGAPHAVEDVAVVHGVERALQLEVLQVEHGERDDAGLEGLEEPRAERGRAHAEGEQRGPRSLHRINPMSRYQNIVTARATAAATPMTAESSMLPVPGSRYASAGDATARHAAITHAT